MKKIILALLVLVCGLSACKKSTPFDPIKQAADDDVAIQAYIKANNITATKDSASGLYYQIITQGTGANANSKSTVTVNYTGKLLNGSTFDTTNGRGPFTSSLQNVIAGWTIGVPFVKVGGRILLLIPSGLGYGNNAAGSIPANSVLVFTIDLLGVQ